MIYISELREKISSVFASQALAVLATQKDSRPYANLVAFAATEDLRILMLSTSRSTRKFSHILDSPQVALLIDNRTNSIRDLRDAVAITALGRAIMVKAIRGDFMTIFKMHSLDKSEYDLLLEDEHICRIAFKGEIHPYIAPFLYIFDGKHMYFLSSNYGRKLRHFKENPFVTVEVERYAPDLSKFAFVAMPGRLEEVQDPEIRSYVRQEFVELIKRKRLSLNVLSALGHSPDEPIDTLLVEGRNSVWRLAGVNTADILGLKHSERP
jgi:nitroimidazol reductase NimA-like FMN-containing flavoprotein (pyridoxamine 5'-phosphate oxidase superfamily)